jgi:hypothetical protein
MERDSRHPITPSGLRISSRPYVACSRTRFAIMSFCPVALYVGIQAATLLLHCRPLLFAVHQIRTEQIQFVIQGDEVIHKFVLHLAIQ